MEILLVRTLWCLCKIEPFKFLREIRTEAQLFSFSKNLTKQLPRTGISRLIIFIDKIPKKKRNIIFPWDFTKSIQIQFHLSIGISRMPSGKLYVIVGYIPHIPAKGNIAEPQAAFHHCSEFICCDIFTS
ncbi:hypothetical protein D3C85_1295550 [compost metagenome]